jgi:RimJ/RimL family protein N-acetyltransferase
VAVSVRFEPLDRRHAPALKELIRDPDVLRFTRVPVPPPDGFAETWARRYEADRAEGSREGFAILGGDDEFLGIAVVPRIDRAGRTVELGYVVAPSARGRGIGTEALRRLTKWAFEELGAIRAELIISVPNEASKRVAERCGYVKEGVLRSAHFKQDIWEDTEIWSRLSTDPPQA